MSWRNADAEISKLLTWQLGTRVIVCSSQAPASLKELSDGEQARLAALEFEQRRTSWLRGRRALKLLLQRLGEATDTSKLTFPNSRISLSHSGDVAIAVATERGGRGIGVDLEFNRKINPRSARFFLTPLELASVDEVQMLRLWTVKEALFKSDPNNQHRFFADYETEHADAWAGSAAIILEPSVRMRYCSIARCGAFLSVAIMEK